MQTSTLVSVEEYLATSYRPDCDYVDGVIVERNVGEYSHSSMQATLIIYLSAGQKGHGTRVLPEQRVQVSPSRFRVPDVCVIKDHRGEQIIRKPPFLCIEILSPSDTMTQMQERIDDYLSMGVPQVWVIDPWKRRAFEFKTGGMQEARGGYLVTTDTEIKLPLNEIFRGD